MVHDKSKIACVHITKKRIYLLEGRIKDDAILVTHTTGVGKASRFFTTQPNGSSRLAFMADMVSAIANAMEVNSFTARQMFIVYDNDISVEINLNNDRETVTPEKAGSLNFATTDLSHLFKAMKAQRAEKKAKSRDNSGTITHTKVWGAYITEDESGELTTSVRADRDLIEYMVAEFQEHGYHVLSIEPLETTLFYLRKFVPFTYDCLHKLVVYSPAADVASYYTFTKDQPTHIETKGGYDIPSPRKKEPDSTDTADVEGAVDPAEAWADRIDEEIRISKLRNPHVMLAGPTFKNEDFYIDICNHLKDRGIGIIDTYGLWPDMSQPINRMRVVTPTVDQGIDVTVNAQWGGCIAALMRTLDPKPENLVEGMHLMVGKGVKRNFTAIAKTAATAAAIYAVLTAGISAYEVSVASGEARRAQETTSYQLSSAQATRDNEKEKLKMLTSVDTRYDDVFKFAFAHVDDNLNIASIDTKDMIPTTNMSVSHYVGTGSSVRDAEAYSELEMTEQSTDEDGYELVPYEKQIIVIRGYARMSEGPIEFYEELTRAELGAVNIVGIEQVQLQTDETLFAFEMTVGGN